MVEQKGRLNITWTILSMLIIASIAFANPCVGAEDPAKFPSKPITLIVAFGAGGVVDLTARSLADSASKTLGQPIVVINKPGGSGVIAVTATANADPDGYTIGTGSPSSLVVAPNLRSVPFNTKEDFSWILGYAYGVNIFCVLPDSPWKTFKDLIEEARKNPGKLSYATAGTFSGAHLAILRVFSIEKVNLNHVPVAGGKEMITQLLGGHISAGMSTDTAPFIRPGKLRPLMVQSEKRIAEIPEVPTFVELGYKVPFLQWCTIIGPKGMDPRIVKKLSDAFKKAMDEPSFKELCKTIMFTPSFMDSESLKAKMLNDYDTIKIMVKEFGFTK